MDGNGIRVEVDGAAIVVVATNSVAARLFGQRLVIRRADVVSAVLTDAGVLRPGRLELVLRDGSRRRLPFSQKRQAEFADLCGVLQPGAVMLRGTGQGYAQDVVGALPVLRRLVSGRVGERAVVAELRREAVDAVRVLVGGQSVGCLPIEAARAYQPPLRKVSTALCRGRLSWSAEGVGLALDLADPAEVLPLNEPATTPHIALPAGRTYPLSKENEYLETLAAVLAKAYCPGRALVYGSLHAEDGAVTVRVDGRRVGELPTTTSAAFAPLLRGFADAGLTCYADVSLTGDASAVEARLRVVPPAELPAEIVDRLT